MTVMTPKDAINTAKDYVADLFATDGAVNIGLEELRFDNENESWIVTIGFSRRWDDPKGISNWAVADVTQPRPRTFKTVEIADANGQILDLRHWPVAA